MSARHGVRLEAAVALLLTSGCPGSSPDTATGETHADTGITSSEDTETETDAGTDTSEPCMPGARGCECLADGTCDQDPWATGCNNGECSSCFEAIATSAACVDPGCPTDCTIELAEFGYGPVPPIGVPYFELVDLPNVSLADCETNDGWSWEVEGEAIRLCGTDCAAWVAPPADGTTLRLEFGCIPG